MPPASPRWQRRLAAAQAALAVLDERGVDQTRQIDVFNLCEDLGLWLAFVPLDNALGAFVPEGSGGVMITTQRPLTVQRYTAAHELGHWRMDHGPSADRQDEVFGTTHAEREQLAQLFGANLLMPPPLVMSILERIRPSQSTPLTGMHCYGLARETGVSYEAAVRQLLNLGYLTAAQGSELLQVRPLTIKTQLGFGRRPVNGWADVWPVDEQWDDQILDLRLEDEATISLPENRSTGYRWMLADDPQATRVPSDPPAPFAEPLPIANRDEARTDFLRKLSRVDLPSGAPGPVLRQLRARAPKGDASEDEHEGAEPPPGVDVVGDQYLTGRAPTANARDARALRLELAAGGMGARLSTVAGATGRRLLGVRFGMPGIHTIRLVYRSPYTPGSELDTYVIHAVVETRRTGVSVDQLATKDEDEMWVRRVHERQTTALPPALNPNDPALSD
jgi:hypothetical protein